jgi:hypothetical protein
MSGGVGGSRRAIAVTRPDPVSKASRLTSFPRGARKASRDGLLTPVVKTTVHPDQLNPYFS